MHVILELSLAFTPCPGRYLCKQSKTLEQRLSTVVDGFLLNSNYQFQCITKKLLYLSKNLKFERPAYSGVNLYIRPATLRISGYM